MLYIFLSKIVVCKGNTDCSHTLERRIEIKESFTGLSKERLALVESSLCKTRLMKSNFDTIRHPGCFLVVTKSEKCDKCGELQANLFSIRSKSSQNTQKIITDNSKVNEGYLSTEDPKQIGNGTKKKDRISQKAQLSLRES